VAGAADRHAMMAYYDLDRAIAAIGSARRHCSDIVGRHCSIDTGPLAHRDIEAPSPTPGR